MGIAEKIRSLASRVTQCERMGGSEAEVESLRAQVVELEREVSSLEAANAFLRSQNAGLRQQLRDLRDRTGAIVTSAGSWRNHD